MGCYGIGLGRIVACILEKNVIKDDTSIKGFSIPYNVAPYKIQIIYSENNQDEAEKLYSYLLENNISTILDDRDNLTIGNRIKDVYVLGNKFDGTNYEIEDTKTNEKTFVKLDEISSILKLLKI